MATFEQHKTAFDITETRINGFLIHTTPLLGKWIQVKFPRSKKRRIRKKWSRLNDYTRHRFWRLVPDLVCYKVGDILYMHPQLLVQLRQQIEGTK